MLRILASVQRKKQNGSWFWDIDMLNAMEITLFSKKKANQRLVFNIDMQNATDINKFSKEKEKWFMVVGYRLAKCYGY